MKHEYSTRYDSSADFFELSGSVTMQLTPDAAVEVCAQAAAKGVLISRVEGGIWQSPGFGSRLDCIWDGKWLSDEDRPKTEESIDKNNQLAVSFILEEMNAHDVFIVSTAGNFTGSG